MDFSEGCIMKLSDMLPARWNRNRGIAKSEENTPFLALHREMNRLFDDFFEGFGPLATAPGFESFGAGVPSVDVSETDQEVHVEAELPGVDEKDLEVTLADGVLHLRGEKKFEKEQKEKSFHRVERAYGSFQRSIPLPADVDESKVDAVFKKGVLHVTLPKTKQAQARRRISVKTSE
jgi:HSP20 family protein